MVVITFLGNRFSGHHINMINCQVEPLIHLVIQNKVKLKLVDHVDLKIMKIKLNEVIPIISVYTASAKNRVLRRAFSLKKKSQSFLMP